MIISAKDDKESEIKAFRAGADDYIKKPIDFDILVARLEARLRFGGTNVISIFWSPWNGYLWMWMMNFPVM